MPYLVVKRRVAQDIDPWGRIRHVLATNVEEDLYHYFVTLYDINNWNYCYQYAVHTIGDQYIYGIKTFDEFPVTPYEFPIYTYQVANKGYADYIAAYSVTFENLNSNGDVGVNSDQVAAGDHSHDNLPTDDQKDAMDTALFPSGSNPFLTWDQHADHSNRHEAGGADEISVAGLNEVNVIRVTTTPYTIQGTDDVILAATDGGDVTLLLPAGIQGRGIRIANVGSSGNDAILTPDGGELLHGVNVTLDIRDTERFILNYDTTEGWW